MPGRPAVPLAWSVGRARSRARGHAGAGGLGEDGATVLAPAGADFRCWIAGSVATRRARGRVRSQPARARGARRVGARR